MVLGLSFGPRSTGPPSQSTTRNSDRTRKLPVPARPIEHHRAAADGLFGGFGHNDRDDDRDNRPSRDRICVYEDINYGGRSQCWNIDEEEDNLNGKGWNDRISSSRVFGRARVAVYRDSNYRGGGIRFDRDTPDLGAINWSDQISSIQVR